MTWDWSSPIALGLFLLMAGGAAVLLGLAVASISSGVKALTNSSANGQDRRRGRR